MSTADDARPDEAPHEGDAAPHATGGRTVEVPSEASPGSPAYEPAATTAVDGVEPEDAWRQGIHLTSDEPADADGSGQARSGYWDDEDDPEGPDET